MRVSGIRNLAGPNVYSHQPVLVMTLDLEDLAYRESCDVPGFVERLLTRLPGLHEHYCALGRPGGFVERLHGGTWFGHIVEHVAIELSQLAGIPVNRGKTVDGPKQGTFLVAVAYTSEAGMRYLLNVAVQLVQSIVDGCDFPLAERIRDAREIVDQAAFGPSTQAIVDAAERRGIPWRRVDEETSLIRLGYGIKSRAVQATISAKTSVIAVDIASNKHLTKQLLEDAGLPVPAGRVVTTAADAASVFRELGPPVVVKPLDGNQGRGVSLSVADEDQLAEAFRAAQEHSNRVVIEQMVTGRDYRVLIVNGAMIAASEKTPAHVIGDGSHTIAELIEITNRDPRRGEHHSKPLSCIKPDAVMTAYLARSGRGVDSVPASGEWVLLRESANLSTGGEARDVTDDVHPTIARLCERAARVIGLDIAGIDIVLPDISEPFNGGGIVEVNAAPGIRMHESPSQGQPRNAASAIVDMLFPNGSSGRIPIVAITGTNGKTTTTRMIGSLVGAARKTVGMTTTDGIYIGGHEVARGDMTGPWSARVVLSDPTVEVAVLETARGGIVRSGLGYDWSDVAVYTNIQRDHIGQDGIESVDDIYRIKRLVAERVREGGTIVLNADDEILARLPLDRRISGTPRQIVYFSLSSTNPLIQTHVHAGGTAYVLHAGWIEVRRGESQRRIVRASTIPCTLGGTAEFQIANALAAIAAAAAVGMSFQDIVAGLETFQNGCQNSGRVNLFELNGGVMVIDYGHNAHAITGIVRMVSRWPAQKRIAVLGLPGDRTDDLIIDATCAAASGFERIILREDNDLRGREPGELTSLMHQCLREQFPAVQVETILDEVDAVRAAAGHMRPGDVVVAFCDRKDLIAGALRELNAAPIPEVDSVIDMLRERVRIPA